MTSAGPEALVPEGVATGTSTSSSKTDVAQDAAPGAGDVAPGPPSGAGDVAPGPPSGAGDVAPGPPSGAGDVAPGPPSGGITTAQVHTLKYERAVFLSDAVFAIAITLLVLDLRITDATTGGLETALRRLAQVPGPLLAFVISFFVIAAYWTSHRDIFGAIHRMNGRLIWINLVFLFWIALQPFAAAVLGAQNPAPTAVVIYALVQVATGLSQTALWVYAISRPELADARIQRRHGRWVTAELLRVPAVFGLSIPLALLAGPVPAMASWLLVIPLTPLIRRHYGEAVRQAPDN